MMEGGQRVFFELAYDGRPFHGWQRQPHSVSVQQVLEEALAKLTGQNSAVVGCGRTDAGVHASYYVAHVHFEASPVGTERLPDFAKLVHKLNGVLPPEVAVFTAAPVAANAHARFSALERTYTYWLHLEKDPFLTGHSTRIHRNLDVLSMQQAAATLVRSGDFSAFCKAGSDSTTTLCDVRKCELVQVTSKVVRLEISADRFLRNMVRAIMGTLLEIGQGRRPVEDMERVFASQDRAQAGKSAPSDGLYLHHIAYPPEIWQRRAE
jgi:tRNA pseudouridine38-40 synthase